MQHYRHIFFDLDHTLWDFDTNSRTALTALFDHYQLADRQVSLSAFLGAFYHVNSEVWSAFNRGSMDKETLRRVRFSKVFVRLGLGRKAVPVGLEDAYLDTCPAQGGVMPGTLEVLETLKDRYQLHILTNGFQGIQQKKMAAAGIDHFFDQVITAECIGARKPDRAIFLHAMERTGASPGHSMMIGDNLHTDIFGAKALPMDYVYYNPQRIDHTEEVNREIDHLSQLSRWL